MIRPSALLLTALAAAAPIHASAQTPTPTVSVVGEGEAAAAPDMATVTLGVSAEAPQAEDAAAAASARAAQILAALQAEGVAERDLRTVEISLSPIYVRVGETGGRRLNGYAARHSLHVTVRRLEAVGPAIDAAVAAGANEIGRIEFGVADDAALVAEARRRAVADAAAAAALIAEAAGRSLGAPISFSLGGSFAPRPAFAMRAEMAALADAPTPVAPGEIVLRETVSAVYALD